MKKTIVLLLLLAVLGAYGQDDRVEWRVQGEAIKLIQVEYMVRGFMAAVKTLRILNDTKNRVSLSPAIFSLAAAFPPALTADFLEELMFLIDLAFIRNHDLLLEEAFAEALLGTTWHKGER